MEGYVKDVERWGVGEISAGARNMFVTPLDTVWGAGTGRPSPRAHSQRCGGAPIWPDPRHGLMPTP